MKYRGKLNEQTCRMCLLPRRCEYKLQHSIRRTVRTVRYIYRYFIDPSSDTFLIRFSIWVRVCLAITLSRPFREPRISSGHTTTVKLTDLRTKTKKTLREISFFLSIMSIIINIFNILPSIKETFLVCFYIFSSYFWTIPKKKFNFLQHFFKHAILFLLHLPYNFS